jgi:hypothetical protein
MIDLKVPVEGVARDALDAFLCFDQSPPDSAALIFNSGPRVIARTPLADPPTPPRPRQSPVAPRIVRSERGLSRRLAKEDLRIAPRFFDRDETPAIFVTSLVFDKGEVDVMSSGSIIAVAAPHGPLLPSICRFASRARPHEGSLATGPRGFKSLGDPKQWRNVAVRRSRVSASAGSAVLSPLKILSFWKRPD